MFVFFSVAAVSVPKKKRKMKELNKKEAVGDLLDAFKEVCVCVCALMYVFINFHAILPVLMSLRLLHTVTLARTETP